LRASPPSFSRSPQTRKEKEKKKKEKTRLHPPPLRPSFLLKAQKRRKKKGGKEIPSRIGDSLSPWPYFGQGEDGEKEERKGKRLLLRDLSNGRPSPSAEMGESQQRQEKEEEKKKSRTSTPIPKLKVQPPSDRRPPSINRKRREKRERGY